MRIPLLTLCSLTAYAAHDFVTPAQADEVPIADGVRRADSSVPIATPIAALGVTSPEILDTASWSRSAADAVSAASVVGPDPLLAPSQREESRALTWRRYNGEAALTLAQTQSDRIQVEPADRSAEDSAIDASLLEKPVDLDKSAPRPTPPEAILSPLERPPTRLLNLETANQLDDGAVQFSIGLHQPLDNDSPVPATGNQLYYGTVDWGVTEDLQLGFSGQFFDDPTAQAIEGEFPDVTLFSLAPSVKYRVVNDEQFSLGVQGSAELFGFESDLFDTDDAGGSFAAGSLHLPMTYGPSSEFQLHLTPSVAFHPDSVNGEDFYGTIFSLGGGVSWQPSARWLFYSALNLPVGPGGNAIDPDDQSIDRQLAWTLGSRYNVTPKVGVDLYATNSLGVTPTTSILTAIPDGSGPLIGLRLSYTPDTGLGYRSSFRDTPLVALSDRDRQLVLDGFTLSTASTLQPGTVLATAGAGTNGDYNFGLAYSPDQDFQLEASIDEFGSEDRVTTEDSAGENLKYFLGARVRLLDQIQGDPLSLAVRVLGGRDTGRSGQLGTLFVDVPVTYQMGSRAALFFNPRLAAFFDNTRIGFGFGMNYEVARGLQLIGEVTPVLEGEPTVWAVGSRYQIPRSAVNLDLYATNAIGRYGLGSLAGDSQPRLGFNFNWIIGDR